MMKKTTTRVNNAKEFPEDLDFQGNVYSEILNSIDDQCGHLNAETVIRSTIEYRPEYLGLDPLDMMLTPPKMRWKKVEGLMPLIWKDLDNKLPLMPKDVYQVLVNRLAAYIINGRYYNIYDRLSGTPKRNINSHLILAQNDMDISSDMKDIYDLWNIGKSTVKPVPISKHWQHIQISEKRGESPLRIEIFYDKRKWVKKIDLDRNSICLRDPDFSEDEADI